jgi:hypothetical protein
MTVSYDVIGSLHSGRLSDVSGHETLIKLRLPCRGWQ